ncbi:hypothetical protein BBW69_03720 [Neisseria sp. RH3002v2f]|nr:hypothetical protein [Neisseria sp. RH3002v2f]MBD0764375.1 hypothetical protein [Neisseria sp. RH3002v2f]
MQKNCLLNQVEESAYQQANSMRMALKLGVILIEEEVDSVAICSIMRYKNHCRLFILQQEHVLLKEFLLK